MTKQIEVLATSLTVSAFNARAEIPVEPERAALMAASIKEIGMIHPMVVHEIKPDTYGVIAGRNRLAGVHLLAEDKPDMTVFVTLLEGKSEAALREISLAENTTVTPMSDLQIFRSVEALVNTDQCPSDEMMADALGVGVARMRRIKRMAFIHPTILDAYDHKDISLQALQAYGASDDQAKQVAVFEQQCEKDYNRHAPHEIKAALGFNDRELNKMLSAVSLDTYKEAGGKYEANLFDEDDVRIHDSDLLVKLFNARLDAEFTALQAEFPDRDLTLHDDLPMIDGYPDYALRAHAEWPEDTREEFDNLAGDCEMLFEELVEVVVIDEDCGSSNDTIFAAPAQKGKKTEAKKLRKQITDIREKMDELDATQFYPAAATYTRYRIAEDGKIVFELCYPDRQAAGFSSGKAKAKTVEAADDAAPALTNRAESWLRSLTVSIPFKWFALKENKKQASRASKALAYAYARNLAHGSDNRRSGLDYGSFAGDYNHAGTPHNACHMDEATMKRIPGMKDPNYLDGWKLFDTKAKQEHIDLIFALHFASRIDPIDIMEGRPSLAIDVLQDLQEPAEVRKVWTPDFAFFDLFKKDAILGWIGDLHNQLRLDASKDKVSELKTRASALFSATPEAKKKYGMADSVEAASKWVPEWLSFGAIKATKDTNHD